MASSWTKYELELILIDYFQMFELEINGKPYKKSAFRKALLPKLGNRTEGSIEFKHQNISAVLLAYNIPYINGYKPRFNYQKLLEEMVIEYLIKRKELDNLFVRFSTEQELPKPKKIAYSKLLVDSPPVGLVEDPKPKYSKRLRKPNFIEIEQENKKLGELGEELVVEYEKWRLINIGKEKLSEKIEWISKDRGDGAGFDILSKNPNGSDRYIEVKTTKLGELTPFYFTRNELKFSQENSKKFYLYRVFKYHQNPNLFIKNGSFDEICRFEPTNFVGRIS